MIRTCPIIPVVPITEAEAKFVPTAILGFSLRMDIIAGILMLPKTKPYKSTKKSNGKTYE